MKYAADFRSDARDALRGRWPIAILTGFVASLIGANIATGGAAVPIATTIPLERSFVIFRQRNSGCSIEP